MNLSYRQKKSFHWAVVVGFIYFLGLSFPLMAQEEKTEVEINGDEVSYVFEESKMVAKGNVSAIRDNVTLYCDRMEFNQTTKMAYAEGHVVLLKGNERLTGEKLEFNFGTMTGSFDDPTIYAHPFYGKGKVIERVGDNHMRIESGYLTTSDLDKPEYRIASKKIDIYPGEKSVARHVRFLLGDIPVLYLPRFTQDLREKKPVLVFTPGYEKNWGSFLLSQYRYRLTDNVKGTLHMDYRQRLDLGWGLDLNYKGKNLGNGMIRTYYTNERETSRRHFFDDQPSPTIEKERFMAEWRHKWNIDKKTNAIWQYFKLSDPDFLDDYFENLSDEDQNPSSFFLLTRIVPGGILSLRGDARVNRFDTMVERLPELNYNLTPQQLGGTGLYWQNDTTYSNLVKKTASPSEHRPKTMRLHTDNELSYPLKISFMEFKPFVGSQQTYYSRAIDEVDNDTIRTIFRTGSTVSTKFYKIYDMQTNFMNLNINRLRHVFTPTVGYSYQHDPTLEPEKLNQFDPIDAQTRGHMITFSYENKLQTKRYMKSFDLVRAVVETDYILKEDLERQGFNEVRMDLDITPIEWLKFYVESLYNLHTDKIETVDFDLYFKDRNKPERWYASFGKRFAKDSDDIFTTELGYRINQKWAVRGYQRSNVYLGDVEEWEASIVRDLHAWTGEINFNHKRDDGDEILMVFTLKAFPELGLDFGTGFHKRKPGSNQTTTTTK